TRMTTDQSPERTPAVGNISVDPGESALRRSVAAQTSANCIDLSICTRRASFCTRRQDIPELRTAMKPIVLYRIAAVLFGVFAAGHTIGFLKFRPPTPEGLAVFDAMNHVQFEVKGSKFTYGAFYTGFGLFATLYLLFSAFLAWHLGNMARE